MSSREEAFISPSPSTKLSNESPLSLALTHLPHEFCGYVPMRTFVLADTTVGFTIACVLLWQNNLFLQNCLLRFFLNI